MTYFTYILTNKNRTVLYIGVTNDIVRRIYEHREDSIKNVESFTARYNCIHLVYLEEYLTPIEAIEREKQLKRWSRSKKEWLIGMQNPRWKFLEQEWEEFNG